MKREIFSVLFALVLVLSFSMVTAVPAGAGTHSATEPTWYFKGVVATDVAMEHVTVVHDPLGLQGVSGNPKFMMLWGEETDEPGHAYAKTSEDGLNWSASQSLSVTFPEESTIVPVNHPEVIYDQEGFEQKKSEGIIHFKMWFYDFKVENYNWMRYAESVDGISWQVFEDAPVEGETTPSIKNYVQFSGGSGNEVSVLYKRGGTGIIVDGVDQEYVGYQCASGLVGVSTDGAYFEKRSVPSSGGPTDVCREMVIAAEGDVAYRAWDDLYGLTSWDSDTGLSWASTEADNPPINGALWSDFCGAMCVAVVGDKYYMYDTIAGDHQSVGLLIAPLGLPTEVWVDGDWTSQENVDPNLLWQYDAFATIQGGINAVDPSGTVNVANGNYNATILNSTQGGIEEGWWFVTINKSLDLIGESRDGVILDGSQLYNEYRSAGIWVSASDVTIKNLTIQNFYVSDPEHYSYGLVSWQEFRNFTWAEELTLSYVTAENLKVVGCQASLYFMGTEYATVKDCIVEGSRADGIWIAMGSPYATVQGNTITNSADHGIWVGGTGWCGPSCPNATIIDNTIDGAREGGISFVASDGATISGNTITNVAGEDPSVGGWSVGALSFKDGPSNVEAFNNTIFNNDGAWNSYNGTGHGIGIDGTPSNINLHDNNIYGNTGYGCYNYSTVVVMATNNWWGLANGPEHAGNTFNVGFQGDKVSGNVDYVPWLDDVYATGTSFAPVNNTTQDTEFSSIQAAINDVQTQPGDTISVAAGTYNEAILIDRELTLKGANAGIPSLGARGDESIIKPDDTTPTHDQNRRCGIYIAAGANDVTIDGFEIDGTGGTVHYGIYAFNSDNVIARNNVVHDIMNEIGPPGYDVAGVGILYFGWEQGIDGALIESNTVYNTGRMGIIVCGATDSFGPYLVCSNSVIKKNTVYDTWQGPTNGHGGAVQINGAKNSLIQGNTIYNTGLDQVGIYIEGSVSAQIIENDIYNNRIGIMVWSDADGIVYGLDTPGAPEVHLNDIHGNAVYGLEVIDTDPAFLVDATRNWWGHACGPGRQLSNGKWVGKGDKVSDNVDYKPWLHKSKEKIVPTKKPSYTQSVVLDNYGEYGWNTFSAPIFLDDEADTWKKLYNLTDLDYSVAYRFDSDIQEFVLLAIDDEYAINPGEGFFIKMNDVGSLAILYSTEEKLIPPSRPLTAGWNLIGLANLENMDVEDALASIATVPGLAGYSQVVSPIGNVSPGPVLADGTIYIGESYWVYMLGERTLAGFTMTPVKWVP